MITEKEEEDSSYLEAPRDSPIRQHHFTRKYSKDVNPPSPTHPKPSNPKEAPRKNLNNLEICFEPDTTSASLKANLKETVFILNQNIAYKQEPPNPGAINLNPITSDGERNKNRTAGFPKTLSNL
jgi:hypothetical protein